MPGPEDILKQLGGATKPKTVKSPVPLDPDLVDIEDFKPPLNLTPPTDLASCPCCGTMHREFYQEQFTNLPSVTCKCGVKVILDLDNHNKVLSDNWNRRNSKTRADGEVNRWLAILDINVRDDDGVIQAEPYYDPYTFNLVMNFFQELMIRKHQLEIGMMLCPFCGGPDFIDRRSHLQCANMDCSAVIPAEYFNALINGKNPQTVLNKPAIQPDVKSDIKSDINEKPAVIMRDTTKKNRPKIRPNISKKTKTKKQSRPKAHT